MAQSLEDTLAAIAAAHNFNSVTVGRMPVDDRVVYTASVHYDGYARDGIGCEHGKSDDSIRGALNDAIEKAAKNRRPSDTDVGPIPALAEAA